MNLLLLQLVQIFKNVFNYYNFFCLSPYLRYKTLKINVYRNQIYNKSDKNRWRIFQACRINCPHFAFIADLDINDENDRRNNITWIVSSLCCLRIDTATDIFIILSQFYSHLPFMRDSASGVYGIFIIKNRITVS